MSEFSQKLGDLIEEAMRRHDKNPRIALWFILEHSNMPRARLRVIQDRLIPPAPEESR